MRRTLLYISFSILVIGMSAITNVSQSCTDQKLKDDLRGDWKGEDDYSLRISADKNGRSCFSIVDPYTKIVRNVRDVLIIDGELRHLAYYTPITDGYVVCVNIKLSKDSLSFDWFSSYGPKSGKDIYVRTPTPSTKQTGNKTQ
jgi:hypothetical protein